MPEPENNGSKPVSDDLVELKVFYRPSTGEIGVTGCIDHPIYALGLLDFALDLVKSRMRTRAASRIAPASLAPFSLRRGF